MGDVVKAFIIIASALTVIFIPLIVSCFKKKTTESVYLGIASIYAVITLVSYTLSISFPVETHYNHAMINSTLYFTSIDMMLLFLIASIIAFTKTFGNKSQLIFFLCVAVIGIADVGMLFTNALVPEELRFVVTFTYSSIAPTVPVFNTEWPFFYHLGFTYFLITVVISILHSKARQVPKGYKRQYIIPSIVIAVIVLVNATFLLIQEKTESAFRMVDFSVLFYAVGVGGLYYCIILYREITMPSFYKSLIFNTSNNAVVVFDYENKLLLKNDKATKYFPDAFDANGGEITYFANLAGVVADENENHFYQCYIRGSEGEVMPLRCDYSVLKNKKGLTIAKVFYFQDVSTETDSLTGFQKLSAFYYMNKTRRTFVAVPKSIALFDINALSTINATKGRAAGDQAIQSLADKLREFYPKDTYFVRGKEGSIFAISPSITVQQSHRIAENLKSVLVGFDIESSSIEVTPERDLNDFMDEAETALDTEKLLNTKSNKSNLIASLIKTLEETDADTESHVQRTTIMAERLGKRLGLSDYDLSRLKVLTILHDIGKVAIPLEILNKPGKLTDTEYEIMKSHTIKGYEIANSNKITKNIANDIRQHHERWDGKGYPDGLSKESISYLARIVSVVDSFDAMVNNRVYRKALTWEEAKEEVRNNAGSQFDPKVAAEFLRFLDEVTPYGDAKDAELLQKHEISSLTAQEVKTNNVFAMDYAKYILDENDYIVEIDKNFTLLTGFAIEDIKNKHIQQKDLIPSEDLLEYKLMVEKQFAQGLDVLLIEHRIRKKDGSTAYVYCIGRRRFEASTKKMMSEIYMSDCSSTHAAKLGAQMEKEKAKTQRKQWELRFRKDGLTGLLTHTAFENDISAALLKGEKHILFIMMDLDGFKQYNDTKGHKAGDEYLILVANHMAEQTRKYDLTCRLGGDEFAIAMFFDPEETKETVKNRAESIITELNGTLTYVDKSNCRFSAGASISGPDFDTFDKIYVDADKALYASKASGKGILSFGKSLED